MDTKICATCKGEFEATTEFFGKVKKNKDGLAYSCKTCVREYNAKYRKENAEEIKEKKKKYYNDNLDKIKEYRKENAEVIAEGKRKYRQENKEKVRAYKKEYREKNRERYLEWQREYHREYRKKNRERISEMWKTWVKENPERYREISRKGDQVRRAREASLPHTLTYEEWEETLEFFNHSCAYCGDNECKLEQEHFIPVSHGGGYTAGNIIPACRTCNASKNGYDFFDWYINYDKFNIDNAFKIMEYFAVVDTLEVG